MAARNIWLHAPKDYSYEYSSWKSMRQRCLHEHHKSWKNYGGRGITICERWLHSFDNFYDDMGPRPDGMTLEREDNDGPYSPENCHWASRLEQGGNRRDNRVLTYRGKTMILAEWARHLRISKETLQLRLKSGMPEKRIFQKGNINVPRHGTTNMYQKYACRCDECREGVRKYYLGRKHRAKN